MNSAQNLKSHDDYPTRVNDIPEVLLRKDPIIWGTEDDGPLAGDELDQYAVDGCLSFDSLLDAEEVELCRAEMIRLANDPRLDGDDRVALEGETNEVRSIFEVHRISDVIRTLLGSPKILDTARQILGSEVYVHQSRVNYKPGFDGGPFHWHSDFETWHAEDGMPGPRAFSISIALTSNYPYNGALMIMPGSHQEFISCVGETPGDYFRQSLSSHDPQAQVGMPDRTVLRKMAERYGIRQFTGSPGSATLFDANCIHGSNSNITPFPRSNIFAVFNSVENSLVEPFSAPRPRPEFIASRDFTPLAR